MSNNLNMVPVAQGQVNNGVVAINNALGRHDAAMTEVFDAAFSGILLTLTDEELIGAQMFICSGSPGSAATLEVPVDVQRGSFWVYNGTDQIVEVGISGQSAGKPKLDPGSAAMLVSDGTNVRRAAALPWSTQIALSDESTGITTGDAVITTYVDSDVDLLFAFIGLSESSSSGPVIVDVNKNGSTIFDVKPQIDEGEDTSHTGTEAVLGTTFLSRYDKLTFDIDAAGTGAKGLKIVLAGTHR